MVPKSTGEPVFWSGLPWGKEVEVINVASKICGVPYTWTRGQELGPNTVQIVNVSWRT